MSVFINGIGNISPQRTWDPGRFLDDIREVEARMIQCLEPEVDPGLDEKFLRRMNRLLRLGWIAAKICLEDAGKVKPDAIITGSGWGSVQDSEKFLLSIYKNKESLLPPTPFIQSTHNALGSQIAILLESYQYNIAYAHASFAFEHALTDGIIRLGNGDSRHILAGGFDEITANQFILHDRIGRWRKVPVSNLRLLETGSEGTVAGEGFAFFLLGNEKKENTYAEVKWVETIFGDHMELDSKIMDRLRQEKIDWVFAGFNGDTEGDRIYRGFLDRLFPNGVNVAAYKHLCGEYMTSTAFATWAAANALKRQSVPGFMRLMASEERNEIGNILVYNHYKGKYHSFILLTKA